MTMWDCSRGRANELIPDQYASGSKTGGCDRANWRAQLASSPTRGQGMELEFFKRSASAVVGAPATVIRGVSSLFWRTAPPVGARPGTLVVDAAAPKPELRVMSVRDGELKERELGGLEELDAVLDGANLTWVDVQGFGDEVILDGLRDRFDIHPLAMEDVIHVPQRPKCEEYAETQLIILRMLRMPTPGQVVMEQLAIFATDNVVVTFQERPGDGDVLDPVRERLRIGKGKIRSGGPGYLAYALMDTVVDAYFPLLESMAEHLEELEQQVLTRPVPDTLRRVYAAKRTLQWLRRTFWPTRDALNRLVRDGGSHFSPDLAVYLRDTHDHSVQIADVNESYREFAGELTNLYMSLVSNRMNEIMKVLTIMASIFIPLTFFAGIYGMNFEYMPELKVRAAYPILLGVMAITGGAMVAYFWRRGWIFAPHGPDLQDANDTGGASSPNSGS